MYELHNNTRGIEDLGCFNNPTFEIVYELHNNTRGTGEHTSLPTLDLNWCMSLTMILEELGNLTSLTTLHLRSCMSLSMIPMWLHNLISFITSNIYECELDNDYCRNLTSLTTFDVWMFRSLTRMFKDWGSMWFFLRTNDETWAFLSKVKKLFWHVTWDKQR